MRVCRHGDARSFLARAEGWLREAEIERAVALASALHAAADDSRYDKPLYWATVEDDAGIAGCAFRTPPYRLGVTALPEAAIAPLADSVDAVYGALSGVSGPEPAASTFAAAWRARRGGAWSVRSRQRLFEHKALVPEQNAARGALRLADGRDAGLAREWGAAFARESGVPALGGAFCAQLIPVRQLYFWDDGEPACMLGVLRETADAAAIGVVYTPPALRERGYAAAALGSLSRSLLERGLGRSYVYAHPDNAAAAALCNRLGYGVVQDAVDIDFA